MCVTNCTYLLVSVYIERYFRGRRRKLDEAGYFLVRPPYLPKYVFALIAFLIFFSPEVSTTQPESSSEEEDERPSSPGLPSDSSDSEDDQGTNCMVL